MPMNVQAVATLPDRINQIRLETARIVNDDILPNESKLWVFRRQGVTEAEIEESKTLRNEIQTKVKEAGLWAPHLPEDYGGSDLSFLEHAYMNEILAYCVGAASLFGVVAPNSGNQKILLKYGTEEQKQKWLDALDRGEAAVGLLDDRTRQRGLRSALDPDDARPQGGRRVGHQRPQVVHVERVARGLPDRHVPHGGPGRLPRSATAR